MESEPARGPIGWMIHNRVTPNLLMIVLMVGGIFMSSKITREVFPAFELDNISISVAYPGASPEEVEQGIILAIEESIQSIEGIKEITSTANEGSARVVAELLDDASPQKVLQDIEQEVDRVSTFPEDAEDPIISISTIKRQVLQLNIFGNVGEEALRLAVENVRDQLLQQKGITQIDLRGARDYEIGIAISRDMLRKHNLSIDSIASSIASSSVEIPGGKLETSGGEILLRVKNKSQWARDFAGIPIISSSEGTKIYLGDIATVRDGFEDTTKFGTFNKQPSIQLYVYRVGGETPIGVSDATRKAMEVIQDSLPPDIHWAITSDRSDIYKQRLQLLLKNAFVGLFLVLLLLGLFLEMRLAFWVTMGIPISFLGGLLFLPFFDVSINVISMFAFIIALGIVVDDAIIAGENIYEYRQRGLNYFDAAVAGAKDVAIPITFSILTNIVAFLPMAFVPGVMGKVWRVIPIVVIVVFLISWFESLFILPAHLAHSKENGKGTIAGLLYNFQQKFAKLLLRFIDNVYGPVLTRILSARYFTTIFLIAVFLVTAAYVKSGRIRMILSPRVESDSAVVTATLPFGSPASEMIRVRDKLLAGLDKVAEENGQETLLEGTFALIDGNTVEINAYLTAAGVRPLTTGAATNEWRKATGPIAGTSSIRFESDRGGPGGGASISVKLRHRDTQVLDRASVIFADQLSGFSSVKDVDSGYALGKIQHNYQVNAWGESLGLSSSEIGRQIRNSFQGAIALRQQRGNNEVTVRIRLPEEERSNEFAMENFLVRTPAATYVPLSEVSTIEKSRAYTTISRMDGRRTATVSANVDPIGDSSVITEELNNTILPELAAQFPGLSYEYSGRQADRQESTGKLLYGFLFALGAIYFLLAIPFRSYIQPIIVMIAIPFGIIGAVLGHMLMGYNLSLMSMMGVVALSGVVVNDALVLVDYANKQKRTGIHSFEAILRAGIRRFRPVLLTTLTTFGGLAPMIFETSRQARFMIPMAISLGFGILFATLITLALVPCLYLIIDDWKKRFATIF